jgi:hypothetical protein
MRIINRDAPWTPPAPVEPASFSPGDFVQVVTLRGISFGRVEEVGECFLRVNGRLFAYLGAGDWLVEGGSGCTVERIDWPGKAWLN